MSDNDYTSKPVMPRPTLEEIRKIVEEEAAAYEPSGLIDPYAEKRRKAWIRDMYGDD
jgi:hypothetical protein